MYVVIVLILVAYGLIHLFYKHRHSYWHRKGVQQLNPSLFFGDLKPHLPLAIHFDNFYSAFKKRGLKYGGVYIYSTPAYIPIDPEHINEVLSRSYQNFNGRGIYFDEKKQPAAANLLFVTGKKWKDLRQKLTLAFTSGKMKMLFPTMSSCTLPMIKMIEEMAVNCEAINANDIMSRFTINVFGSCALEIECNSFETSNKDFHRYSVGILPRTFLEVLKFLLVQNFPKITEMFGMTVLKRSTIDFFGKIAIETYNYRKQNGIRRVDFMQVLIDLKDEENDTALTMDGLIAQVILFFIAGYDTTSTALTFCLFNLATHVDVQDMVREEIRCILEEHNGEVSYKSLRDMKYMEQVLKESMRKYPLSCNLARICTEDYKIPNTNIIIEKGTPVYVPFSPLHRDPEYFPDPDQFKPERFSKENRQNIVPGTFMPFGHGARVCIGERFGIMQMKICLTALLKEFKFSLNSKTRIPLEIDFGIITAPRGGIWLNAVKIS